MRITVEISLYPLQSNYGEPILDFIQRLQSTEAIQVRTNHMSTQVTGDYRMVMEAITDTLEGTLAQEYKSAIVMKIFGEEVELEWLPPV